jgi:sulfur carrier protein ThiS
MTPTEVREVVKQVMLEERQASAANLDLTMMKTVSAILTSFGIEDDERAEIRQDFRYLRRWRRTAERVTNTGVIAIVTVVVGGVASATWLGVKALIGK